MNIDILVGFNTVICIWYIVHRFKSMMDEKSSAFNSGEKSPDYNKQIKEKEQ